MVQIASITFQNIDEARPIIEAVKADNPGLRVMEMPGAVKLDRDESIVIRRASVEDRIGRDWDPQELHLVLVSMAGNVDEDDDTFTLSWSHA